MVSNTIIFINGDFNLTYLSQAIGNLFNIEFTKIYDLGEKVFLSKYLNFQIDIFGKHEYVDDELEFSQYEYVVKLEPKDYEDGIENYKKRHILCRSIVATLKEEDSSFEAIIVDDFDKLVTPYDDFQQTEPLKLTLTKKLTDSEE